MSLSKRSDPHLFVRQVKRLAIFMIADVKGIDHLLHSNCRDRMLGQDIEGNLSVCSSSKIEAGVICFVAAFHLVPVRKFLIVNAARERLKLQGGVIVSRALEDCALPSLNF